MAAFLGKAGLGIVGLLGLAAVSQAVANLTDQWPPLVVGSWYVINGTLPLGSPATPDPNFQQGQDVAAYFNANTGFTDAIAIGFIVGQEFTLIARWAGPGFSLSPRYPGVKSVAVADETQIPAQEIDTSDAFDPGIPLEVSRAVCYAAGLESNPQNLQSFARSLLPDWPLASSYLLHFAHSRDHAKIYHSPAAELHPLKISEEILTARYRATHLTPGEALGTFQKLPPMAASGMSVGFFGIDLGFGIPIVDETTDWIVGSLSWSYDNLGQFGILIPVVWEGITAERVISQLADGKSLGEIWNTTLAQQLHNLGHAMRLAAGVVSFFPGWGTIAGALLNLAAGLALGEDMSDLAIDVVAGAIPGGALAQETFRVVGTLAVAYVQGDSLGEAFRVALRAEVVRWGGDVAGVAYDAAFGVIVDGRDLGDVAQDTGQELVAHYGGAEAETAYLAAVSAARGKSVGQVAATAIRDLVQRYGGSDAVVAYDAAVQIAQGKTVEQVAIDSARRLITQYAGAQGQQARQAFDLAVAIGSGQGLQQAGFQTVYSMLQGQDAPDRAVDFMDVYRKKAGIQAGSDQSWMLPDGSSVLVVSKTGVVRDLLLERLGVLASYVRTTVVPYPAPEAYTDLISVRVGRVLSEILHDPETDPTKQLANLSITDLAGVMVDRGILSGPGDYAGPNRPMVSNQLECDLARACILQKTVTPQTSTANIGNAALAPGASNSISVLVQDPAPSQATRAIPSLNRDAYTRVFSLSARNVPASTLTQAVAATSLLQIVTGRFDTSPMDALIEQSGAIKAAAQAVDTARAQNLVARGQWVRYYSILSAATTTTIKTAGAQPNTALFRSLSLVSEVRKEQMLEGSPPDPQNPNEGIWYAFTFGGSYGDSVAQQNRVQACKQLAPDPSKCS